MNGQGPEEQGSGARGQGSVEGEARPSGQKITEMVGQSYVTVERCNQNYGHFWTQIGTAELRDGTKVTIGQRTVDGGLYFFVGEGAITERFVVPTKPLVQGVLAVIENWLQFKSKYAGLDAVVTKSAEGGEDD